MNGDLYKVVEDFEFKCHLEREADQLLKYCTKQSKSGYIEAYDD